MSSSTSDHNPALRPADKAANKGDESSIERPAEVRNVKWQTRAAVPSEYENRLGDALQAIFADGVYDLDGILRRLNDSGITAPGGVKWTEASFTAEMARLGA